MTKHPNREARSGERPERWLSRTAGGAAPEDRVASLMRAGERSEGLAPAARARVWARLDGAERGWRPLGGLRWGVAALVLLASAGVVAGVTTRRWWPPAAAPEAATYSTPAKVHAPRTRRAELPRAEAAPIPTEPALVPVPLEVAPDPRAKAAAAAKPEAGPAVIAATAPLIEAASPSRPRLGSRPRPLSGPAPGQATPEPQPRGDLTRPSSSASALPASPAHASEPAAETANLLPTPTTSPPPAPAPPSAFAVETPLLGEALTLLRQQRDARGALAALDTYDARFPRGALRREADGARVDALLLLGRDDEALAVLRRLTLQAHGRDQELRVVRAELSAATSCSDAVDDFGRVLTESPTPALAERALHGRATCLGRLGDGPGAQRDLREYLRRFPEGRFAADARRTLGANNL
jgi:hypothetical protein